MYRSKWSWSLILALLAVALYADEKPDDKKKLEGTWLVQTVTVHGEEMKDLKEAQFVFTANTLTIKYPCGMEMKCTYQLDPTKKPKTADLAYLDKKEGHSPGLVIYEIQGDTLQWVIGSSEKRPVEFSDDGQVLVVLKRKK